MGGFTFPSSVHVGGERPVELDDFSLRAICETARATTYSGLQ